MNTKNTGIALATELAEAGKQAIFDFDTMVLASKICQLSTSEEISDLLFKYSGTLTATVATRITHILMTESELEDMVADIQMFDEIANSVLGDQDHSGNS